MMSRFVPCNNNMTSCLNALLHLKLKQNGCAKMLRLFVVRSGTHQKGRRPCFALTETYDFQCDETIDAELAALPQEQLVDRLLAARGSDTGTLVEIKPGYWGEYIKLAGHQPLQPSPGAWTSLGSPEWLAELFPGLDDEHLRVVDPRRE